MPTMRKVQFGSIAEYGYDTSASVLVVVFRDGRTERYADVPLSVAQDFYISSSTQDAEPAFASLIRGHYKPAL